MVVLPRGTWPAELAKAVGDETPDFVVHTDRAVRSKAALRLIWVGFLALIPIPLMVGLPMHFGGDGTKTGLIVGGIFSLAGLGFIALGTVHHRRRGGWFAGTPTRLVTYRRGKAVATPWRQIVPIITVHEDGPRATVIVGEGRAGTVAAAVIGPGLHIADIENGHAVAERAWHRLTTATAEGDAGVTLPDGVPSVVRRSMEGTRLDFAVKGTRTAFVQGGGFVGLGLIALGLLVAGLGLLTFTGHITMTDETTGEALPSGAPDGLLVALFGVGFAAAASPFLLLGLIQPLRPGPWFFGTARGLLVARSRVVRRYGWRAFHPDVDRPLLPRRTVVLHLRPGMGGVETRSDNVTNRGLFSDRPVDPTKPLPLPLIGCRDVDRIDAAVRHRLDEVAVPFVT